MVDITKCCSICSAWSGYWTEIAEQLYNLICVHHAADANAVQTESSICSVNLFCAVWQNYTIMIYGRSEEKRLQSLVCPQTDTRDTEDALLLPVLLQKCTKT